MPKLLDGHRILVVEDDYLAAIDMSQMIEECGGTVVGPVARLEQALVLARSEELDGAVLDVKLNGGFSYPVADELTAKGVSVVFVTGYESGMLPERFAGMPRLAKPVTGNAGGKILRRVFAGGAPGPAGRAGGGR